MPEHDVPPELEDLLHRADSAFGTLRTSLMRAYELPIPDYEGPTPEELSSAAGDPAASKELRAVNALVQKKKLSWDDVLAGRADGVPEVAALQAYGHKRIIKLLADGPSEPDAEAAQEPPAEPAPERRRRRDDDEGGSMMRDAW